MGLLWRTLPTTATFYGQGRRVLSNSPWSVDDTLWPEFVELDRVLRDTLERATDQVISQVFEQETSEAEVREDQQLVGPVGSNVDKA